MSNRVNDQNRLDQKLLEERQEYTQKQTDQRKFSDKLFTQHSSDQQQKQLGAQTKSNVSADAKKSAPSSEESVKNKASTTQTTSMPVKSAKATPQTKSSQSTQTKKTDQKKESKKVGDDRAKSDKKKNEAVLTQVAKQKEDTDLDDGNAQDSEAFFQQAVSFGAGPAATTQSTATAASPTLSQDAINQLVDKIYASTNTQGLSQLTIELKSGVLAGAQIQVSTNKGKVQLHFRSDDQRTKTLLRNSRGEIAKRLGEKNLSLSEFVVD